VSGEPPFKEHVQQTLAPDLPPAVPPPDDQAPGITPASVAVAVLFVILLSWFSTYFLEKRVTAPAAGGRYLPMVPVMVMLLLVLFNIPLRALGRACGRRLGLGRKELLVVFAVTLISEAALGGWLFLIGLLPSPYYYASPENELEKYILDHHNACPHLFPFRPQYREGDRAQIELLYRSLPKDDGKARHVPWYNLSLPDEGIEGTPKPEDLRGDLGKAGVFARYFPNPPPEGRRAIWQMWLGPVAWWMALFALGFFVQFCMMAILRRQWIDNEKLMFPQIEPLRAVAEYGRERNALVPQIVKSGAFWAGFGVSAFLLLFDGLNHYLPAVPSFHLGELTLAPFLTDKPWSAVKPQISIQPFLVAIAFFLTAEMSFSIWFFALFDQLSRMASSLGGLPPEIELAWNAYDINQGSDSVGAIFVLVIVLLWAGRRHFREILAKFVNPSLLTEEDAREPMPYRFSVVGFLVGTLLILAWCRYAGMRWWVSGMLFGVWYVILIFLARLVSEVGVLNAGTGFYCQPPGIVVHVLGFNEARMASTFTVNVFIWPTLHGGYGAALLAYLMQAAKAAEEVKRTRILVATLFAVILAAMAVAAYRLLGFTYSVGALNTPADSFREVHWVFSNTYVRDVLLKVRSHSPDWSARIPFMMIGAAVMSFLVAMRHFFYWWPLHPIGYVAIGIGRGAWFSFFLGWFLKRTVLKYGGGELLKKVTPAVVGLFIGQFFASGCWFIVDLVLKSLGWVA